jgi:hypothetical protein
MNYYKDYVFFDPNDNYRELTTGVSNRERLEQDCKTVLKALNSLPYRNGKITEVIAHEAYTGYERRFKFQYDEV